MCGSLPKSHSPPMTKLPIWELPPICQLPMNTPLLLKFVRKSVSLQLFLAQAPYPFTSGGRYR